MLQCDGEDKSVWRTDATSGSTAALLSDLWNSESSLTLYLYTIKNITHALLDLLLLLMSQFNILLSAWAGN